jgi:hypothetical protein
MCATFWLAWPAFAADPGIGLPPGSEVSDQKEGSVLVFPYYTSSASSPGIQDTRISITNSSTTAVVALQLFLVTGDGAVLNGFICLTSNQTFAFKTSDWDPGFTGFIVVVAVGLTAGEPINFNFLTGRADIKLASGHRASLMAEAIAAIANPPTSWVAGNTAATLNFDGVKYNRLPRALAVDKLKSVADGNSTLLILSRVTGVYTFPNIVNPIGPITGILLDDAANAAGFSLTHAVPQLVQTLSNSFPATTPSYTTVIPSGRTGWVKLWTTADAGLFGAVINLNPSAATGASAFSGGHNLRKLTLSTTNSITIPAIAPPC